MILLNIFSKIGSCKKLLRCILWIPFTHLMILIRHPLVIGNICIVFRQWWPLLFTGRYPLFGRNCFFVYSQWGPPLITVSNFITGRLGYSHWFISISISQLKDYSISVYQAIYSRDVVSKYLDTATIKENSKFYKTTLTHNIILIHNY